MDNADTREQSELQFLMIKILPRILMLTMWNRLMERLGILICNCFKVSFAHLRYLLDQK